MDKQQRKEKFLAVWKTIRDELVEYITSLGMPSDAIEWYGKNLDYNVPGGKLNRGMSVVDTAEIIKGRPLSEPEYFDTALLGWCIELLQAFFLVSDDIMDSSITRRGQPCWYRNEGIAMIAINDAFMLEGAIYYLLKRHFRSESFYVDLLDLMHETTYQTEVGQLIDLISAKEGVVDLAKFSLKKHNLIVVYKTAFYSFYLPVALAMRYCRVPGTQPYEIAKSILIPLGEYFQIQDDFLDFSGTPEQIGKIGTDIVDNKCSWCVNTALAHADASQRKVLDENYGRKDAICEQKVKDVFEKLKLREKYAVYEADVYQKLTVMINAIPETKEEGTLKREVFTSFLSKIYKRTK